MGILERFLRYVSIDTTSDSKKTDTPSTEGQRILAELLIKEMEKLNLDKIYYDKQHCYIYGLLKGQEDLPKIGFVSHLDTSESAVGHNITPNIIYNYKGENIVLNDNIIMSTDDYPDLKNHIGKTLITTDGRTLLGADDKAGIAEVMQMLQYYSQFQDEHGDIFVCFTPDEEIGLGTTHLDKNYFYPDFAYTVDGSGLGEISYENFNAATAIINIKGLATHCGSAKGKMINAGRVATLINYMLPDELPETTEKYEGYFHLAEINGNVNQANLKYLIRDFSLENFEKRKQLLFSIVSKINQKYNNCVSLDIKDKYYNMFNIINGNPDLIKNTLVAISNTGVNAKVVPIRGGTDGTDISFSGIPCPNLGTGGHNFHSVYEYVCLEDMQMASEILISIVKQFSKINNKKKIKK